MAKVTIMIADTPRGVMLKMTSDKRLPDPGKDGGSIAQRSMYLLLQSRARMGNCESVIEIGRRYANRFKGTPAAPEAIRTSRKLKGIYFSFGGIR